MADPVHPAFHRIGNFAALSRAGRLPRLLLCFLPVAPILNLGVAMSGCASPWMLFTLVSLLVPISALGAVRKAAPTSRRTHGHPSNATSSAPRATPAASGAHATSGSSTSSSGKPRYVPAVRHDAAEPAPLIR